jgi:small subunit ribosomal protein S20
MPNIKSAKKRMELSRVANARNRANRSRIKTAIRRVRDAENVEVAQERLREAVTLLDRAATKNLLPANRAARVKSQLTRHVNQLSAAS